jgi:hypothetical protein
LAVIGQGIGGGAYIASGGVVCLDMSTSLNTLGDTAFASDNNFCGPFTICP